MSNELYFNTSRYRSLRFLGGNSVATTNEAIVEYVVAGRRTLYVFTDDSLADAVDLFRDRENLAYKNGLEADPWRVGAIRIPQWSDATMFKDGYRAAIHSDPDELIFQREPVDATIMHHAWEIGHWVTCGVVADDELSFAKLVCELFERWPGLFTASDADRIVASFEGRDVSELVRDLVRSSSKIKFWYPKEAQSITA
jgi:hypothetical protein